ncbi:hypothetical protein CVD19_17540 [Bacillus sp. T33-2]|nr:hypothetical protein CVD19_17540 [Bacillus sp. T33-2]
MYISRLPRLGNGTEMMKCAVSQFGKFALPSSGENLDLQGDIYLPCEGAADQFLQKRKSIVS